MHREPIYKICIRLIEKMLIRECSKSKKQDLGCISILNNLVFIKSVLVYAGQIQFYLTNQNELTFAEQLDAVDLRSYDLWRTMDSFFHCDPTMPKKLKLHFYDLER